MCCLFIWHATFAEAANSLLFFEEPKRPADVYTEKQRENFELVQRERLERKRKRELWIAENPGLADTAASNPKVPLNQLDALRSRGLGSMPKRQTKRPRP